MDCFGHAGEGEELNGRCSASIGLIRYGYFFIYGYTCFI